MKSFILLSFFINFNLLNCFSIAPDSICNKDVPYIFTETSGDIYSPGYLSNRSYPEGIDCKWSILIPSGQYLKLKFEDLDLDESIQCQDDSLSFFVSTSGVDLMFQRVCGSWKPKDIFLDQFPLLKIQFTSDYIFSGRGFHLSWSIEKNAERCSKNEFACASGECVPISTRCNGKYECVDGSDELKCKTTKIPEFECGKQKIKPDLSGLTDRILGGDVVIPGSWPWQADLQIEFIWPSGHYCGGTLIHPQYVLTAGHCIAGNPQTENMRIVLGNHNSFKNDGTEQIRLVESVITYHEGPGKPSTGEFDHLNDFALIKLNVPVTITDTVSPVCVADSTKKLKPGTKCYVTGWGSTRGTGNSDVLKQIIVQIEDITSCSNVMSDNEEVVDTSGDAQICIKAGGHGSGICSGDSGGPLVCQEDDTWYLFGVASMVTTGTIMGPICGDGDGNAIFGNVRTKTNWLHKLVKV